MLFFFGNIELFGGIVAHVLNSGNFDFALTQYMQSSIIGKVL